MADHLSGIIERLDLDAIEARANAATPGPWLNADKKDIGKDWLIGSVIDCGTTLELSDRIVTTDRLSGLNVTSGGAHEDAEFIAHALTEPAPLDHRPDCQLYTVPTYGLCTCDFDARKKATEPAQVTSVDDATVNRALKAWGDIFIGGDPDSEIPAMRAALEAVALPLPVSEDGSAMRDAVIEECVQYLLSHGAHNISNIAIGMRVLKSTKHEGDGE